MRSFILLWLLGCCATHVFGQPRKEKPYLPVDKDQRKVVIAAEEAARRGAIPTAIALLDSALALNYDHMVDQRQGMLKLLQGDSVGFCSGIRTSALLTKGALHERYLRECTRTDSVRFDESGLDPTKYPKVPTVRRTWSRADGRTEHRLIGHDGSMIVGLSTLPGDTIYIYSGVQPSFPGGEDSLFNYLGQQLRKTSMNDRALGNGLVYVQFVVEVDGSITNIATMTTDHGYYSRQAKKLVAGMPAWRPGQYRGVPVRVRVNLPLRWTNR